MATVRHGTQRWTSSFPDAARGKVETRWRWNQDQYKGWVSNWTVQVHEDLPAAVGVGYNLDFSEPSMNKGIGNYKRVGARREDYPIVERPYFPNDRTIWRSGEFAVDQPLSAIQRQTNGSWAGTDHFSLFRVRGNGLNVVIHVFHNVWFDVKPSDGYGKDTMAYFLTVQGHNNNVDIQIHNGAQFNVSDDNYWYREELKPHDIWRANGEVDSWNNAFKAWCGVFEWNGNNVQVRRV